MEYPKIETLYDRDPVTFKVNPDKIRNRVYGIIKSWHWTEKIDGTNIRLIWDGTAVTVGGRTDKSQIPADLVNTCYGLLPSAHVAEIFQCPVIFYGEGYGSGIQKGGSLSATKKFILFDVLVDGKWWLDWENTQDVAIKLGLDVVPYFGEMTLEVATENVRKGFNSLLGLHPKAEGLVGRTIEPLFDKRGHRLIVKLKTKDF